MRQVPSFCHFQEREQERMGPQDWQGRELEPGTTGNMHPSLESADWPRKYTKLYVAQHPFNKREAF